MTTAGVQLFQILKIRLGQWEAEALVSYMDTTLKENNRGMQEINLRTLATKEDLARLEGRLETKIAEIKGGLVTGIAEVKGDLETKISEVKSDVIRWTFAFFVTMMLAILGLYLKK
jgi:hypothetical protein